MVMERGVAAASPSEIYQQMAALHPMQRMGKPEEIAAAVLWLFSEAASCVRGHALLASVVEGHMSGGMCAPCDMNGTCCDVFVICRAYAFTM
jgi:NAD(P)-dependent dehydrogenase (short-subunit alcohol dehydrogenase family)